MKYVTKNSDGYTQLRIEIPEDEEREIVRLFLRELRKQNKSKEDHEAIDAVLSMFPS